MNTKFFQAAICLPILVVVGGCQGVNRDGGDLGSPRSDGIAPAEPAPERSPESPDSRPVEPAGVATPPTPPTAASVSAMRAEVRELASALVTSLFSRPSFTRFIEGGGRGSKVRSGDQSVALVCLDDEPADPTGPAGALRAALEAEIAELLRPHGVILLLEPKGGSPARGDGADRSADQLAGSKPKAQGCLSVRLDGRDGPVTDLSGEFVACLAIVDARSVTVARACEVRSRSAATNPADGGR